MGALRALFWQAPVPLLELFAAGGMAVQQDTGARCMCQNRAVGASSSLLVLATSFSTSSQARPEYAQVLFNLLHTRPVLQWALCAKHGVTMGKLYVLSQPSAVT